MAVFRSLAFAERTKPYVARLTANTSKRAPPVAIPCNDALFVLLVLFMIFSNRVALAHYSRRKKSIERDPRPSNALDSSNGGDGYRTKKLLPGGNKTSCKPLSIRILTYVN